MSKWFTCKDEEVLGPFTKKEAESLSPSPGTLICNSQSKNWVLYEDWLNKPEAPKIKAQKEPEKEVSPQALQQAKFVKITPKKISQTQSETNKEVSNTKLWYFFRHNQSCGPLEKKQLIDKIKESSDYQSILVWSKGMKNWSSIYDCYELNKELSGDQRRSIRVDIEGQVIITKENGSHLISLISNIGTNGFSCSVNSEDLIIGKNYAVEINSPQLTSSISCLTTLCYLTAQGCGFKFEKIHRDHQAQIIDRIQNSLLKKVA